MRFSFLRSGRAACVAAIVLMIAGATQATAACRADAVELRGDWGQARFRVELAQNESERSQGLMFRETMSRGAGMLFIYPRPQRNIAFWMRNTFIPLDILFFDSSGTLTHVHHMARPHDETRLPGGSGVQYVLEINGGQARDMGIAPGTELRHPAISPDAAAWPC